MQPTELINELRKIENDQCTFERYKHIAKQAADYIESTLKSEEDRQLEALALQLAALLPDARICDCMTALKKLKELGLING